MLPLPIRAASTTRRRNSRPTPATRRMDVTMSTWYGPSDFDIPNRVSFSYVYHLPFGRGQPMLQSRGRRWILGNWTTSGAVHLLQRSSVPGRMRTTATITRSSIPTATQRRHRTGWAHHARWAIRIAGSSPARIRRARSRRPRARRMRSRPPRWAPLGMSGRNHAARAAHRCVGCRTLQDFPITEAGTSRRAGRSST